MNVRRTPEPLSRDRIVRAALEMIDRDGLDALTMRRLGKELGVDPMAIYYHLPNKSALYDAIMDDVVGSLANVQLPDELPFEEFMVEAGTLYRKVLLAHVRALPLLTLRPLRTEHTLAVAEMLLARCIGIGLSPGEAMAALNAFGQYIAGETTLYAQHLHSGEYHEETPVDDLATTLDPDRFPNLVRVLAGDASMGFDDSFEFALRAFARGLEASAHTS
ncbi:MAG: TetR/AcrR family transcriptional regulator C-terminal domain-containing protein [Coriobacteriia bacterium]|nr:TetR/AcrR family transcriptional regulator C-terminal domain-containing protein [Coriobacteriia bacterium]